MVKFNQLTKKKDNPLFKKYNVSGIYGIYICDELIYVGSSVHCMERFLQHKHKTLLKEKNRCKWRNDYIPLYQELRNAYENNKEIYFEVLCIEINKKMLREVEREFLKRRKPKCNVKNY